MFIFQKAKIYLGLTIATGILTASTVIPGAVLLPLSINYQISFNQIRPQDLNFPGANGNVSFMLGIGEGNLFKVSNVQGADVNQFTKWLGEKLKDDTRVGFINKLQAKQPGINKMIDDIYNGTAKGCSAVSNIKGYKELQFKVEKNNADIDNGKSPVEIEQLKNENEKINAELKKRDDLLCYYNGINDSINNAVSSNSMWIASFPLLIIGLFLLILAITFLSLWLTYVKRDDTDMDDDDYVDNNFDFSRW